MQALFRYSGFVLARGCKCQCPVSNTQWAKCHTLAFPRSPVCLIVANPTDSASIHCVSTASTKQIALKLILSDSWRGGKDLGHQSLLPAPSKTYGSHRKPLQPRFSSDEMREAILQFD